MKRRSFKNPGRHDFVDESDTEIPYWGECTVIDGAGLS